MVEMQKIMIKDVKKSVGRDFVNKKFEIEGKITRKHKTEQSKWREHALCTLEDDTGSIPLNLWREQVHQAEIGDTIRLKGAFVKRKAGVVQLSTWEENIEILNRGEPNG